jgi:hypothetical protein
MYWQIQAILEELFALIKEQYAQRPRLTMAAGFVAALLLLKGAGCIATALLTSPPPEAFAFRKIAGAVRYDDDTAVPSTGMLVCFFERGSAQSLGCATIGEGDTDFATTLRLANETDHGRGVVVTITSPAGAPLPADVLPTDYATLATTPLTADLSQRFIEIRLRKP